MISKRVKVKIKDLKLKNGYRVCGECVYDENYDWGGLKNSIIKNGYDVINYEPIHVLKNNMIYDGNHRFIVLSELFDDEYEIIVLKSQIPFIFVLFVTFIFNLNSLVRGR